MSRADRDRRRWIVVAAVLGVVFFAIGLSDAAYEAFSPPALGVHVLLRKIESVVAFFALGYAVDRALLRPRRSFRIGTGAAAIAAYSAVLEAAQALHGSHEGLGWNAVDVLCGALGGALADLAIDRQRRGPSSPRPPAPASPRR